MPEGPLEDLGAPFCTLSVRRFAQTGEAIAVRERRAALRMTLSPRGAGVGFDAVTELHRFGRPRHAPYGGGGEEMVTQLPGVQPFPPAPLVAHSHDIGDEHVFFN